MAQREVDSPYMAEPPVTQALLGTPVSQPRAEFRVLRPPTGSADLQDHLLVDQRRQAMRGAEFPFAPRAFLHIVLNITLAITNAPDGGIAIAGAARSSSDLMRIRDGPAIPIPM
jgi:hypothetical protein